MKTASLSPTQFVTPISRARIFIRPSAQVAAAATAANEADEERSRKEASVALKKANLMMGLKAGTGGSVLFWVENYF